MTEHDCCAEQVRLLREIRNEVAAIRRAVLASTSVRVEGRLTDDDGHEIVRSLRKLAAKGIRP